MTYKVKVLIGVVLVFGYLFGAGATANVYKARHTSTTDCTEAIMMENYLPYDRCMRRQYDEEGGVVFAAALWPAYWALSLGYTASPRPSHTEGS